MLPLIIWAVALIGIVYFNARYWHLCKDTEDNEANDKKEQVKPLFEPYKVPFWHEVSYWFKLLVLISIIVLILCNAID